MTKIKGHGEKTERESKKMPFQLEYALKDDFLQILKRK